MLPRKGIILLVVLLGALPWLVVRQQRLSEAARTLVEVQQQQAELEQRIAAATDARDLARRALRDQRRTVQEKLAAVVQAEQELTRVEPEIRWSTPPATEPEWDDHCPYIWVSKTLLPKLPGSPFTEKAELREEVAAILTLDKAAQKVLNERLARLLSEYRAVEAAHVERIAEPLPGIQNGPHVTVRIGPVPEEGARLKRQFEETLRAGLGQQRAELLLAGAGRWLESQFGSVGTEAKTISVCRHPDGTYNISIRTGNSWFSTGGVRELSQRVPDYLLPFFAAELSEDLESVRP